MFWAQKTLKDEIACTGIGLHSGQKVNLRIRPALPNTGIVFKRVDLPGKPEVKAHVLNVADNRLATTIGQDGVTVSTIEHLLAAFWSMGVDNAIVELDAPEVPIMDGSAAPFVYLIKSTGLKAQLASKKIFVLKRPLRVREGDKWIHLTPVSELELTVHFMIDFDHPLLKKQTYTFHFSPTRFEKEISRARTFGFLKEVEWLRAQGLARGGSLDNAVVIDEFRILNKEGLRYKNEFVRHKILDLVGDLALLGCPLIAKINAYKSGHALNHKLAKQIWRNQHLGQIITLTPPQKTAITEEATFCSR
ncbi:MAG: UDP-3-O-acyl-N-acetylglucosamine deacetylase [Candidatus Desulfofervidaceae bacterium]|nr:UDP-3-O-acyl-N-acetylglucosamine deacetylase [Candidatus Desulfofervidaceae bacterium]